MSAAPKEVKGDLVVLVKYGNDWAIKTETLPNRSQHTVPALTEALRMADHEGAKTLVAIQESIMNRSPLVEHIDVARALDQASVIARIAEKFAIGKQIDDEMRVGNDAADRQWAAEKREADRREADHNEVIGDLVTLVKDGKDWAIKIKPEALPDRSQHTVPALTEALQLAERKGAKFLVAFQASNSHHRPLVERIDVAKAFDQPDVIARIAEKFAIDKQIGEEIRVANDAADRQWAADKREAERNEDKPDPDQPLFEILSSKRANKIGSLEHQNYGIAKRNSLLGAITNRIGFTDTHQFAIYLDKNTGEPSFRESKRGFGYTSSAKEPDLKAIKAMLELAHQRFDGGPLRISGNQVFKKHVKDLALSMGIEVKSNSFFDRAKDFLARAPAVMNQSAYEPTELEKASQPKPNKHSQSHSDSMSS